MTTSIATVKEHHPVVADILLSGVPFFEPNYIEKPLNGVSHIPFMVWLTAALKPRVFVELGVHSGNSYFSVCQRIGEHKLNTRSFAVDSWNGDQGLGLRAEDTYEVARKFNDEHYWLFSSLLRTSFDQALQNFDEASVDLIRIDGPRSYEAIKHDFSAWLPKLSDKGVVVLPHINGDEQNCGVSTFFKELCRKFDSFSFFHGEGLGVLIVGKQAVPLIKDLCSFERIDPDGAEQVRAIFSFLGTNLERTHFSTAASKATGSDEDPQIVGRLALLEAELNKVREEYLEELRTLKQETRILNREKSCVEYIKMNLLGEVERLKGEVKRFGESNESLRHELVSVQRQSFALELMVNSANEWARKYSDVMHQVRSSRSWQFHRVVSRFGSMVFRGEDGGCAGFLRWLVSRILPIPYVQKRSYDPLSGIDLPPPYPVLAPEINTKNQTIAPLPHQADAIISQPVYEEPRLVLDGGIGAGTVSVIIPVKGSVGWLAQCLDWLMHSSQEDCAQVIIVDDGSTPEEREQINELSCKYRQVSLVENRSPPGFAGACNAGACFSESPFLLFLNSDCLVPPGLIQAMVGCCEADASVGLVTAMANNAATLSLPMPTGSNFVAVNELLQSSFPFGSSVEACTVVGHCLLITKNCFKAVNGFDVSWGLGYGEESDLQMRANRLGYRGVVVQGGYVYHFGGGTFRNLAERAELQKQNHARFLKLWGEEYQDLNERCREHDPVEKSISIIAKQNLGRFRPDIQFILPGFKNAVGGMVVVVDLCNHLIRKGLNASTIILGQVSDGALEEYNEPLYFMPTIVPDEQALLGLGPQINPRIILSTLFITAFPGRKLADMYNAQFINFVQGYEFYFGNGSYYHQVRESYFISDMFLTTSDWLAKGIQRHAPGVPVYNCPLGIDSYTHFPCSDLEFRRDKQKKLRVVIVLRSSVDKGQWLLSDIIERLSQFEDIISLTLLLPSDWLVPLNSIWLGSPDTRVIRLPLTRQQIAATLRTADVFVDASMHEGYGLMPLEAMGNGCVVVCSSSGGVSNFVRDGVEGFIIERALFPEDYIGRILELAHDNVMLARMRANAVATAKSLDMSTCADKYVKVFEAILSGDRKRATELEYFEETEPLFDMVAI